MTVSAAALVRAFRDRAESDVSAFSDADIAGLMHTAAVVLEEELSSRIDFLGRATIAPTPNPFHLGELRGLDAARSELRRGRKRLRSGITGAKS